jgi:UDP-GlcNAc3NAcA epimerase
VRIVTVIGNRPQFVKAAAVSGRVRARGHEEYIVHTGQHYDDDLSRVFFDELGIPDPDRQLGVGSAPAAVQTGRMLEALDAVLAELRPELVMVYGDTNTTLAGALAAAQARVPVAHVEAGMRSFDRSMPEELNRVLTDHASDLLLCSTETAVENLGREGIAGELHLVGDVMADVALAMAPRAREASGALREHGVEPGQYVLVTAHRAGNVDDPDRLRLLVDLLLALPLPVVFPVHPRTRARLAAAGELARLEGGDAVRLAPPLGYLDLLALAAGARAILTDSGGLQKEAYLLGVPCITLRDRTEWVETVDAGWNVLVDLDRDAALAALGRRPPAGERPELYGGGRAAERICDVLDSYTPAR